MLLEEILIKSQKKTLSFTAGMNFDLAGVWGWKPQQSGFAKGEPKRLSLASRPSFRLGLERTFE